MIAEKHGDARRLSNTCDDGRFPIAELVRTLQVHHPNLPQSKTALGSHRACEFLVAAGVGGSHAGNVAT